MRYLCCQNLVLRLLTELWDVNYDLDEVASLIEENASPVNVTVAVSVSHIDIDRFRQPGKQQEFVA